MSGLLRFLGSASIIGGIIAGIVYGMQVSDAAKTVGIYDGGFRFQIAIAWWLSGAVSAVIFFALAMILDHVEAIHDRLAEMTSRPSEPADAGAASAYPAQGKSKPSLESLQGSFKFNAKDEE